MKVEQRNAILEVVGLMDDCLDVVWAVDPPWEHVHAEACSFLKYALSVARGRLKEITAAD